MDFYKIYRKFCEIHGIQCFNSIHPTPLSNTLLQYCEETTKKMNKDITDNLEEYKNGYIYLKDLKYFDIENMEPSNIYGILNENDSWKSREHYKVHGYDNPIYEDIRNKVIDAHWKRIDEMIKEKIESFQI